MKVSPVAGALGAEVADFELRDPAPDDVEELRAALHEFEVLFFPEANLTPDEHMALGWALGEVGIFPTARVSGATEPAFQRIVDGPGARPEADYWHTDVTWTANPPDYALLCAEVIPERGGDTLWASTTAAFDALSPAMQGFVAGLTVIHDNESFIRGMKSKVPPGPKRDLLSEQLRTSFPPVCHPLVRTHPATGRQALFLGGHFMRRVEELTPVESDLLLSYLRRHLDDPGLQCRWRWSVGDLAIWDERSTNHRNAADYFPQERCIRRIEVGSDRPFYKAAS
jgi:taurine dioxygenase